jgi:MFS family permease
MLPGLLTRNAARRRTNWAERLGLPALRGRGGLVTALAVDSIGTGLFLPFRILFFLHTTSLSITVIGTAMTVAMLLSLPTPIAGGHLIDRIGARRVFAIADLLGAVGFVAYTLVSSVWQLIAAAFVVSAGQAIFWTASRALVAEITEPEERPSWFALQGMTRNAGFGLGGLAAAAAVSIGSRWVYILFAALNAASFLITAVLVLRWKQPRAASAANQPRAASPAADSAGTQPGQQRPVQQKPVQRKPVQRISQRAVYAQLFKDRALLLVTGVNLAFVMCANVLNVLLVVYITTVLREPAWLGAVIFTINTVGVSTLQGVVTRGAKGFRYSTVLEFAAVFWAISFLLLWSADAAPRWLLIPGLVLAIIVFTIAEMLKEPVINTMLMGIAPANASGRYAAAFQLSWSVGGAVAPAVMTGLLARGVGWVWIFMLLVCGLAVLGIRRIPVRDTAVSRSAGTSDS